MPNHQAHINEFRKSGHRLRASLSIYKGALVMEGEISAVFPYPMRALAYTQTSGDWNDIGRGFRYEVYTSAGKFKGRSRVGYGESITSVYLPIRENSKGSIDIQVGDILRVYADVRLSDKLVEDDEHFNPDGILIGDNNEDPPPWANSGGAVAGSTKQLPFLMTGSTSFAVDPDSGGDPTHLWTLPTGLSFAGGTTSTDADVQITGDPGEYLVVHAVTDDDNGKSITQYIPVIIHGAGYQPHKVQIESLSNDESKGGSATVKMLGTASFTDAPDGALAILWKEEYIAGVRQSFGAHAPGRSHVLYVGIIRRERGSLDADSGVESLTFELISPLARLEELMGYGKVMLNTATPTVWNQIRLLTVLRTILQLFQFYCNLNEAGYDFIVRPSFTNRNIDGAFIQDSTPLGQAREMAKSVQCRIIEDRRGSFFLAKRPELVALADRGDLDTTLALTFRDTKGWAYDREHWRSVNRVELRGFAAGYGVVQPIFSEWVGRAPGEGNQTSIEEGAIVASQTELNEVAGRLGAALNSTYTDADGATQMALDLTIPLRGVYDVFDLYDEVIELTGVTRKRGIDFADQQYVLMSTDVDFADGTATTTLRLRTCTNGAEGSTFVPPPADAVDYTDPSEEFPEPDYSYTSPLVGIGYGASKIVVFGVNGAARTETFNYPAGSGGPTYESPDQPWGGTWLLAVPRGGTTGEGWIVTTTEIGYYVVPTQTYTVKHTFATTSTKRNADAAFRQGDIHFVVCSYIDGVGVEVVWTDDNATFNVVTLSTNYATDGVTFGINPACFVSTKQAGVVITSRFTSTTTFGAIASEGRRSTNKGASFGAQALATSHYLAQTIHSPWQQSGDGIIYYGAHQAANGDPDAQRLYRNSTDITPVISGSSYGPRGGRDRISSSPQNRLRMLMVLEQSDAPGQSALLLTNDGGSSFPFQDVGTEYRRCAISGDDPNRGFAWGVNNAIAEVTIQGNTLTTDSRAGNLATLGFGEIGAIWGWG